MVHGYQNQNHKMAENVCFASAFTEFLKNMIFEEPKRVQNRVWRTLAYAKSKI